MSRPERLVATSASQADRRVVPDGGRHGAMRALPGAPSWVSLAMVSVTLTMLVACEREPALPPLPSALLDAWAKQLATIRPPTVRRYYVPGTKSDALEARIGQVFGAHDVAYAISHEAAAQRYTPFLSNVSQVRARVLGGANADAAIGELNARPVSEGANFSVIEAKSLGELLFRELLGDLWLASPIQIYLDLLRGEGRAKEMAEHFRKERIGF